MPAANLKPLVEAELDRVTRSDRFRSSARHRRLLRHLVERAVDGDAARLKEMLIAIDVFGRRADDFDPKSHAIVRVEVRRLRQRLAQFYRDDATPAPVRIDLPVGAYVPRFVERAATVAAVPQAARDLVDRGQQFLRGGQSEDALRKALDRFEAAADPAWAAA